MSSQFETGLFCVFALTATIELTGCGMSRTDFMDKLDQLQDQYLSHTSGPVIATIDGRSYSVDDFSRYVEGLRPGSYQQLRPKGNPQELISLFSRQMALRSLAKKMGIERTHSYQAELEVERNRLLTYEMMARLLSGELAVSEAELQHYYETHLSSFANGAPFKASRILLESPDQVKIAQALLKKGKSFESVAVSMSIDKVTASRRGAMPSFSPGQMNPDFEAQIVSLKRDRSHRLSRHPKAITSSATTASK